MSTVVIIKKENMAAIAADTLTTSGSTKEPARYVVNHEKIFQYEENYIGITGSASLGIAVRDFLSKSKKTIRLDDVSDIFRFGLELHKALKENYFLLPDDEDDAFETFRGDILILNPSGIFGLSSYRFVQEYTRFFAIGSGGDFALGAMFAIYDDSDKTASDIARTGVETGAEFDDGSSLPLNLHTIKLK